MFADLLSDSEWSNHSHRGWTTLMSFVLQAVALGCLLLLPLFHPEGLPKLALIGEIFAPVPPPAAPPAPRSRSTSIQSNLMGNVLISPERIPPRVTMLTDVAPPPPMVDPYAIGVRDGTGDPHSRGAVIGSIGDSNFVLPPPAPAPTVHHPPTSRMMEGNLIYKVQPEYPALARQVRVQGLVVLRAIISRDGVIENLQALSGHPLLIPAALNAVRQWRYRPYVLNGEPVEVETEVKVNFILSGG